MAAYAALVSLMNDLELIPIHPTHSFSFDHKQITSLSQIVNFLIDFMESYNSQVLESRIASAANAAHDVIESRLVDQIHAGTTLDGISRSHFLLDLQKAIHNLDFVKKKAILFKVESASRATYSAPAPSETLSSGKNVMVGFDAVVLRLLEMLTGECSCQRVIPIVGMGGLGKTTLTKHVYEHSYIQHHFDVRLWATISQQYSAENILNQLVSHSSRNDSELGLQLHKMLWGRRYLIVLDDMWSVEAWDEVQRFLPDNDNGSCVVVTTRLSKLAARLSSSPFGMNYLDDDQSWELFCGKTFGEEGCPTELEEIGKKIVKRCRGLPLSIVVIGGHLKRSSREIEYWEMVANSMNLISVSGADEECLKTISLSYEHLPACLKPCFLYLGIFEEDMYIHAPQVLRFWIAEGFIKGKKGVSLEEVAEDYLNDLIDRNLISSNYRRKWNGKVEYFVIHDIVRELCLKVAEQEKFFCLLHNTTKVIGGGMERRIVVPRESSSLQPHAVGTMQLPSLLRSLVWQQECFIDELSVDLRLLRLSAYVQDAFDRKNNDRNQFPKQVNLRYLNFQAEFGDLTCPIASPRSLFWNMQTLILNSSNVFSSVPYEIWEMTQLRHLEFVYPQELSDLVSGVIVHDQSSDQENCIVLKNLHTLLRVMNLRLTEEVCKRIPNIKNLYVFYYWLGDGENSSSYWCLSSLGCFNKLESLKCSFNDYYEWRDVVQSLVLPASLEELSLCNCHWEDLTKMIKSLPRLGSLDLQQIKGPEWDLAAEELEFPCLKILQIYECDDFINWNANSSYFPVLETLSISEAPKLSEIPCDIGEIPTLGRIELYGCSISAVVSAMRIVVEQENLGNQDLLLTVNLKELEEVEIFQTIVQQECPLTNCVHLYHDLNKIKAF